MHRIIVGLLVLCASVASADQPGVPKVGAWQEGTAKANAGAAFSGGAADCPAAEQVPGGNGFVKHRSSQSTSAARSGTTAGAASKSQNLCPSGDYPVACGDACCPDCTVCVPGGCCPVELPKPCGRECCPADSECTADGCRGGTPCENPDFPVACGEGNCCGACSVCVSDGCCPAAAPQDCGDHCCPSDTQCTTTGCAVPCQGTPVPCVQASGTRDTLVACCAGTVCAPTGGCCPLSAPQDCVDHCCGTTDICTDTGCQPTQHDDGGCQLTPPQRSSGGIWILLTLLPLALLAACRLVSLQRKS